VFDLSTIGGTIENGFTDARPAASSTTRTRTLRVRLGSGGAHVTVRTFKGAIRLNPR